MAKTKADKAKMHAKAKARSAAKAKTRTKKYTPKNTLTAPGLPPELISRIAPHTTMEYARYMGEDILEFDEGGTAIYLDTNDVVKKLAIYTDENGVEKMTFSNGEHTVFAEYRDDKFEAITEQEFLKETTGELADIDSVVPQTEAQTVKETT